MKKGVSLILASAVVLAMGTTVFAAEGNATIGQGDQTIDVEAKYESSATTPTVYSVDVSWGAMQFTYSASGTMEWNAEDHTYTDNTQAGWNADGNTVTVTNHSNAQISASLTFAALEEYTDLTGSFDNASFVLTSAENKGLDDAELTGLATLNLDGTLDESVTDFTKVGTITVTVE